MCARDPRTVEVGPQSSATNITGCGQWLVPENLNLFVCAFEDFQACEAAVGHIEGTPDTVGLGLRLCDSAQADLPYMADLLAATPQMSTFVDALFRANVTNIAVVAGQVTVFAPRNEAMKAYEAASPEELAKLAYDSIVSGRFSKIELAQMVSFRTRIIEIFS
ncbi:hypothetical protein H632_c1004p1 [Helicosporidium sp. ATCC 50920]|nr:hypothetical protein H632_c1004p1 [Helicosporidium sp. ATCC 50920]|eukprot:KDD74896.1 hypothetical protein H632_c1004p1 [Helicosporidium sp. ATCC 50920]